MSFEESLSSEFVANCQEVPVEQPLAKSPHDHRLPTGLPGATRGKVLMEENDPGARAAGSVSG